LPIYSLIIEILSLKRHHLSIPEKNNQAFAAAHFALKQKRLILSEEHQDWSPAAVEREARRLVFGISSKELFTSDNQH
jgi:hypothetical protein